MDPPIALVLDDDQEFARALADVLLDDGFSVSWATSVADARRHIEAHPIAIVLVDLNLGQVDGRHLLDELAGVDDTPPMVIVSGSEDAPIVAAEFGIPHLMKPFPLDQLLAAVAVTRRFAMRPQKRSTSGRRPILVLPGSGHDPEE